MTSDRILLRQWRDEDLDPYAAMNADPEVMEFFSRPLTREETAESMHRQRALIAERGWGLWAVEVNGEFAGFTGLAVPRFEAAFMPCVEVGWRFRRACWGRGIAFAAARAARDHAFGSLNLPDLVSFTAAINLRSRRLMRRIGFRRNEEEDFLHPLVSPDNPLCLHVLYRLANPAGGTPLREAPPDRVAAADLAAATIVPA